MKIKINDIPAGTKVSKDDLKRVCGGFFRPSPSGDGVSSIGTCAQDKDHKSWSDLTSLNGPYKF